MIHIDWNASLSVWNGKLLGSDGGGGLLRTPAVHRSWPRTGSLGWFVYPREAFGPAPLAMLLPKRK